MRGSSASASRGANSGSCSMGKGLGPEGATARQRAAYEMRRSGSTWEEIGVALEMSPQTARNHVRSAERNGLAPLPKHQAGRRPGQRRDAVMAGAFADRLGTAIAETGEFDIKVFTEMATAAGIPPRLAYALARRVQMNFGPVREELKRLTVTEQVAVTQGKAQLVLSYIDEASIAGMNAKDLATAYGILVDKALVLGGKPNVIVDFNSRKQLAALMPEFMAEARRRGITIDGTATVIQEKVLLPEGADVAK